MRSLHSISMGLLIPASVMLWCAKNEAVVKVEIAIFVVLAVVSWFGFLDKLARPKQ